MGKISQKKKKNNQNWKWYILDSPTREANVKNYFTRIMNLNEMMFSECVLNEVERE